MHTQPLLRLKQRALPAKAIGGQGVIDGGRQTSWCCHVWGATL